ncbi:B12-binding domain-containing radical SAM protein [Candidatus Thiosymbion oneisti]|uniref:B12-binding domain-containing radical SAM protein n=1 Tax=Candidatus Thiosymbion oneisti TaxID=589554 RepID=UPI000B7D28DC|nr:radical SAM protein [Candidatus Thiosymbion oneisti]
MMHTVLLVQPNAGYFLQEHIGRPLVPTGILLVGTALHHAGYQVKIIDQRIEKDWKLQVLEVLKENVICLGISCMTGTQILNGLEIAEFVRSHSTIPIVWGGVHPTLLAEQTLENEFVDIVVRREGEETMVELTDALKNNRSLSGIRGVSYKESGKIAHNPDREFIDLNKQPLPHWELIDMHRYINAKPGYNSVSIATSRGCPFDCKYCFVNAFHKRRWRALNADNVLKMITFLVNKYGINWFQFDDEEFFIDLGRSRELVGQLKKLNIRWEALIRVDDILRMDSAFLKLIKQSGCILLGVGAESGSNKMLELMNKKITREDIIEANRKLAKYHLKSEFYFMVGLPTETLEDLRKTVSLALQLKKENRRVRIASFFIFTPVPGCELHDLAVAHGLKQPDCLGKWGAFHHSIDNTAWFSKDMQRAIRMLAFTSPFLNDPGDTYPPLYVKVLGRLYGPIARQRIKHLFFYFPLEIFLAKWLKLYY